MDINYKHRVIYGMNSIDEKTLHRNPLEQFKQWFDEVLEGDFLEPNAMNLATTDALGQPASRMVLLKEVNSKGFVFFSNYNSRKAQQLAANPACSLVFWWDKLHRQVRIEGHAEKIPPAESDSYFSTRPRGSQLGAWASPQSAALESREELEKRVAEVKKRFEGEDVPRPDHWGGYVVVPHSVEFWQGHKNRLHDRFRYTKDGESWHIKRLAP